MDITRIRVPSRARPFKPFEIYTASGESYRVVGPETMAIDSDESVVIVLGPDAEFAFIDVASITEVVVPSQARRED